MTAGITRAGHRVLICALAVFVPHAVLAQQVRSTVVDQTGLPLPGVTIQLLEGDAVVQTLITDGNGSFAIDADQRGDVVVASLEGFEVRRVARGDADRITLEIARASDTVTVEAPVAVESSPTAARLGNTLTAATVARLPSAHMKARESLPLLPSVVRGADGLMQLGGARAYQTPLLLDGFNVTDPATGLSSLNLPFEAVKGIDALRDPMAVTYGGLLGGVVQVDSRPGGPAFTMGVQGFVPRPRFTTPGFGRLEGIFPRAFASGSAASGRIQYMAAGEYDYERIPVPEVTGRTGQDLVDMTAILFSRVDSQLSRRSKLTVEAFSFPAHTRSFGLSPRRDATAAVDLRSHDAFAGITHRLITDTNGVFTVRLGAFSRTADVAPNGSGPSLLSPAGWNGNWFSTVSRAATRYSAAATWERVVRGPRWTHDVTATGEGAARALSGRVDERPIVVSNAAGAVVRSVAFGPASTFGSRDTLTGVALRDVWHVTERIQIEGGARLDFSRYDGGVPSARTGIRYGVDRSGKTVVKAGFGTFVGALPLAASAFPSYPGRVDRSFDAASGELVRELTFQPTIGQLRLPRARAVVLGVERELAPGLDAQAIVTNRRSSRVAVLDVRSWSGALSVNSIGMGEYREVQFSVRKAWPHDQQLFVSYVRSSAEGELNEFAASFQAMDLPLLQPGGRARTANDARHRILVWGTFNLPQQVVVSPVTEWRSGFPYSALTSRHMYEGTPHDRSFPSFMATDLVVYKTVTVRRHAADLGLQIFNVTNHYNPRDVYPVIGAPGAGQFANSVGPIFRGYMLFKW